MREKLGRMLWELVQPTIFRFSPRPLYGFRVMLLRMFGATVGRHVHIHPAVRIAVPWNLRIGHHTAVGDSAILYSLGKIDIGQYVTISQYAHLCAGTHETKTRVMTLLKTPITIGNDVWIATDAYVGPGVHVGDRAVVGARASVYSDVPADQVVGGNPAKFIRLREFTG
jgi:putative colanic acid biosynthesis acetyltransferase WcaF